MGKLKFLSVTVFFVVSVMFTSCNEHDDVFVSIPVEEPIEAVLLEDDQEKVLCLSEFYGIPIEEVEVLDSMFIIQGDMAFYKENFFLNYPQLKKSSTPQLRQHRRSQGTIDITNRVVYVEFIGNVPMHWMRVTLDAMNRWTRLNGAIRFTTNRNFFNENNRTYVYFAAAGAGKFAFATFPKNGSPGDMIVINSDNRSNNNFDDNDIDNYNDHLTTMLHEFGHILGMAHTDSNEGSGNIFVSHCVAQDPNSIMRADCFQPVFSPCDIDAYSMLYR